MNALELIRETTEYVSSQAKYVSVCEEALEKECKSFISEFIAKGSKREDWSANDFHYSDGTEQTAKFILVLDTLNFCFWPDSELEYHHLGNGLKQQILRDPHSFDADRLQLVTTDILHSWFQRELPNAKERCRLLNEIGLQLQTYFNGSVKEFIESAKQSAATLVDLVTRYFWGFRDSCVYKNRQIFFYKRAQIFVGDLWGAFKGEGLGKFNDIEKLTMFADYRVPQILESLGIMVYNEELSELVKNKKEIVVGSEMEIEIRAVTVSVVEKMRDIFNKNNVNLLALEVDWMLWGRGEAMLDRLPPHHRTRTIFY
ncbi:UPF0553 family protein [Tieghemostelium lacteum]|uniref:Queuosine 5'-phosphate N-glycosylase/hydrolase n=1 Tax=Tieghemostelium lacteum TaxID=361077 RepID=A0A152A7T1_TIELA|nr:UPF0553 family protein [Tieghemostelium lacteum]|eukprot:KYR02293.1 UPF0553 family protein [Tieghemostelium lacteum]